jgi:hypothetical protein
MRYKKQRRETGNRGHKTRNRKVRQGKKDEIQQTET